MLAFFPSPAPGPGIAAVSLSSGGTVEGRIVACPADGRVTLQTVHGCVTSRPVASEWRGNKGILAALLVRR